MRSALLSRWMPYLLSRVSLYSPMLLMGMLALFSYWLVHTSSSPTIPTATAPTALHADYFLRSFSLRTYTATGHLRSEIVGVHAKHYPDSGTLDIEGVRIRSFDAARLASIATADRAVTNADATEVRLIGNARIQQAAAPNPSGAPQTPAIEFRGESLHAFTQTRKVVSDQPVALTHGSNRFTADRLRMDDRTQTIELDGHVRATLLSRATPRSR